MLPDRELDDLLGEMVTQHQKLSTRVADLEKIEQPIKIHPEVHLQLPQLRGYWPMSSVDETGAVYDLSGQGRVLTNHGATPFAWYNLLPYAVFKSPLGNYFSRADEAGLDITGALTVGGWFWLDTLAPGTNMGLISKYTAAGNQRSFVLYFFDAGNTLSFGVSTDGIALVEVVSTFVITASAWYHVVGRFTPGAQLSIFVNGVPTHYVAAIPASIYNSNAEFLIGSYDAGVSLLDGRAAQGYLCADDLDDAIIRNLYNQTRANW